VDAGLWCVCGGGGGWREGGRERGTGSGKVTYCEGDQEGGEERTDQRDKCAALKHHNLVEAREASSSGGCEQHGTEPKHAARQGHGEGGKLDAEEGALSEADALQAPDDEHAMLPEAARHGEPHHSPRHQHEQHAPVHVSPLLAPARPRQTRILKGIRGARGS